VVRRPITKRQELETREKIFLFTEKGIEGELSRPLQRSDKGGKREGGRLHHPTSKQSFSGRFFLCAERGKVTRRIPSARHSAKGVRGPHLHLIRSDKGQLKKKNDSSVGGKKEATPLSRGMGGESSFQCLRRRLS